MLRLRSFLEGARTPLPLLQAFSNISRYTAMHQVDLCNAGRREERGSGLEEQGGGLLEGRGGHPAGSPGIAGDL